VRDGLYRVVDEAVARHAAELHRRMDELQAEVRSQRVLDALHAREVRDRRDMIAAAERAAVASSAEFVQREMRGARNFPHPHATLDHALSLAPQGGMALEFGVYSGTTLKIIAASRTEGGTYGFDSFQGLPENWRTGFDTGAFEVDSLPDVPGAELVVGWFDDTLPGFLAEHDGPVDLLHIDSDLYSSAATVLRLVGPRLHPGSVIVFDEFLNYAGWEQHEARAWQEYVEEHDLDFRYEAYTHDHEQVVVRLV
jgi:predicted O-methyltransferase YrrM